MNIQKPSKQTNTHTTTNAGNPDGKESALICWLARIPALLPLRSGAIRCTRSYLSLLLGCGTILFGTSHGELNAALVTENVSKAFTSTSGAAHPTNILVSGTVTYDNATFALSSVNLTVNSATIADQTLDTVTISTGMVTEASGNLVFFGGVFRFDTSPAGFTSMLLDPADTDANFKLTHSTDGITSNIHEVTSTSTFTLTIVPEPQTHAMMAGFGLLVLGSFRQKQHFAKWADSFLK